MKYSSPQALSELMQSISHPESASLFCDQEQFKQLHHFIKNQGKMQITKQDDHYLVVIGHCRFTLETYNLSSSLILKSQSLTPLKAALMGELIDLLFEQSKLPIHIKAHSESSEYLLWHALFFHNHQIEALGEPQRKRYEKWQLTEASKIQSMAIAKESLSKEAYSELLTLDKDLKTAPETNQLSIEKAHLSPLIELIDSRGLTIELTEKGLSITIQGIKLSAALDGDKLRIDFLDISALGIGASELMNKVRRFFHKDRSSPVIFHDKNRRRLENVWELLEEDDTQAYAPHGNKQHGLWHREFIEKRAHKAALSSMTFEAYQNHLIEKQSVELT